MALSKIQVSSMADNTIHGRRNIIINGSAQCWQRSTSSSSTGYTSADRWSYYAPSSLAISRSTDVPTGFQYATIGGIKMFVPLDTANRHYQAILEWVAEGNTIEEAD